MAHVVDDSGTRRDFLYVATAAAGTISTGTAVWPLINQMNPSADVQALASIQVDVSALEPGSQITIQFLGKPVFIRRRTEEDITAAREVEISELPDQYARNANLPADAPATDVDRTMDEAGEWLVMVGVCTHLGCVPLSEAGDYQGWFCPCHGSHYDTAGRIRHGPAPENLHIPPSRFVSDGVIELG
jgi:ubiquinol-cytochrome c reductase iron-sulfur subunit